MTNDNDAYFVRDGDVYLPTQASEGYWTPGSLNGRLIVGLMGFEIERVHGHADWVPARLTVDMFSLPRLVPIRIEARIVRAGGRLLLVDADFISDGAVMCRASCQFLRRTAAPDGRYWPAQPWDAPPPDQVPTRQESLAHWEMKEIAGGIRQPWPRKVWLRETRALVAGAATTPFGLAASCADVASPLANSGEERIDYINTDATLYLARLPVGEWIGMEASYHLSDAGVTHGVCWLHDESGPIGSAAVAGIVQRRIT